MGCAGSGVAATAALPRGRSGAKLDMKAMTVAEVGGNPRPARSSATALSSRFWNDLDNVSTYLYRVVRLLR
jgi:hypothetical protein